MTRVLNSVSILGHIRHVPGFPKEDILKKVRQCSWVPRPTGPGAPKSWAIGMCFSGRLALFVCVSVIFLVSNGTLSGMDLVFWMCLFVGCTALPMVVDLARLYFPASMGRGGRLVIAWHWERPVMLSMVVCLCMWAYYAFWESVLPYSTTAFTPAWYVHVVGISALWINSVWNYAICAAVDPGFVNDDEGDSCEDGTLLQQTDHATHRCRTCGRHVLHFDHHCPFTGGCIGANNLRFFLLFVLHCWLGCTYASYLAWPPFADCVLRQSSFPLLGLARTPPPDVAVCTSLGSRKYLLLPAGLLSFSLGLLGLMHLGLLANGLTSVQYLRRARRARASGADASVRMLKEFLLVQGEAETDKWKLLWGRPAACSTRLHCARILLLPSLPERKAFRTSKK